MSEGYVYVQRREETGLPKYYARMSRAERRRLYPAPDEVHGTSMGYNAYACLCPRCRAYGRDALCRTRRPRRRRR